MKIPAILLPALSAIGMTACTPASRPPTVQKLDATRYAGEWHEIARLPNFFEKGLIAAKATYSVKSDGKLGVLNQGLKEDGTRTSISGTATRPNPEEEGKLKVCFDKFPANLFAGDYWVLNVDDSYTRAAVGSPNRKFLWLLSKDPSDNQSTLISQTEKAKALGFDTERLIFNPQRIDTLIPETDRRSPQSPASPSQ